MNENELTNVAELTDEQLEAIDGGYIVDLSEWKGHSYYALVNDKTGKVIGYSNVHFFFKDYDEGKENSLEIISMDRYAEIYGKKFFS